MTSLTKRPAWQALKQHYDAMANQSMQAWFAEDPDRFSRFSLSFESLFLDFSKNRITPETLSLLVQLAKEVNLSRSIDALFSGQPVNFTEQRAALHTALRDRELKTLTIDGHNVMADIHAELNKMQDVVDRVHNESWLGATGKPIRDIVNIGIGGSHLGPLMVTAALKSYADPRFHCYFISNVDGSEIQDVLKKIDPEKTLFIISSKSFTT
ncbi:MAG TPA: glucose-6-phosphate isomerase, partial [Gammaproteobacteria bacterium]|nr:glucose-6-phosphate isomerase [Gammaproteobacteria bacterium]